MIALQTNLKAQYFWHIHHTHLNVCDWVQIHISLDRANKTLGLIQADITAKFEVDLSAVRRTSKPPASLSFGYASSIAWWTWAASPSQSNTICISPRPASRKTNFSCRLGTVSAVVAARHRNACDYLFFVLSELKLPFRRFLLLEEATALFLGIWSWTDDGTLRLLSCDYQKDYSRLPTWNL